MKYSHPPTSMDFTRADTTGTWTVSPTPSLPKIQAKIQTDSWTLITETAADQSGLLVLENSLLILICIAFYPVRWFNTNANVSYGFDIS